MRGKLDEMSFDPAVVHRVRQGSGHKSGIFCQPCGRDSGEPQCHRIGMLKQGQLVALDRTSALLAGTASTMLRFKTDAALPPALAAQARVTGRIVQLPARDATEVEHTLSALREAGCAIEDLEMGRADLEDVFLAIMQGRLTPPPPAVATVLPSSEKAAA